MRVSSLHLYAVKGVRAVDVSSAQIEPRGFAGDRRSLVTDDDGMFFTQRTCPALATIEAAVTAHGLMLVCGERTCEVITPQGDVRHWVQIWKDDVEAAYAGDDAAQWLSDVLGRPARLYFMDEPAVRTTSEDFCAAAPVSFADGYPYLLITEASLDALNAAIADKGGEVVPMARFRPNIVIEGSDPWADDYWKTVRIGDVVFDIVKPCVRCEVTTRDQATGARMGKEPLATLATLRRSAHAEENGVLFGWNAIARDKGKISIGDNVEVLEARPEGWPLA